MTKSMAPEYHPPRDAAKTLRGGSVHTRRAWIDTFLRRRCWGGAVCGDDQARMRIRTSGESSALSRGGGRGDACDGVLGSENTHLSGVPGGNHGGFGNVRGGPRGSSPRSHTPSGAWVCGTSTCGGRGGGHGVNRGSRNNRSFGGIGARRRGMTGPRCDDPPERVAGHRWCGKP